MSLEDQKTHARLSRDRARYRRWQLRENVERKTLDFKTRLERKLDRLAGENRMSQLENIRQLAEPL